MSKIEELGRAAGEVTLKLSHREPVGMDRRGRTGGGGGTRVGFYLRQEEVDQEPGTGGKQVWSGGEAGEEEGQVGGETLTV